MPSNSPSRMPSSSVSSSCGLAYRASRSSRAFQRGAFPMITVSMTRRSATERTDRAEHNEREPPQSGGCRFRHAALRTSRNLPRYVSQLVRVYRYIVHREVKGSIGGPIGERERLGRVVEVDKHPSRVVRG